MTQTQARSDSAAAASRAASPAISVRNLRMGYGARVLLDDASFDVQRGEIVVILGGSGSGKSSLMKNIIGLYQPMAGDILIDGRSIVTGSADEKAQLQRKLGVMYQSGALFGSLNVLENVRFPLDQFTDLALAEKNLTARMLLRQVEMGYAESLMPGELSGGMLKRAGIARAMALGCDILLLDEPSAGLDPITAANLDRTILSLRKNLGLHLRGGDPRAAEHLRHRRSGDHAGPGLAQHHRRRQAGRPARSQHRPAGASVLQPPARRGPAESEQLDHGRRQALLSARFVRGGDPRHPGRGAVPARRAKAVPADVHLRDLLQRIGRRPRARCAGALPRRAAGSGLRDPDLGGHLREGRAVGQAQGLHRGPGEGQPSAEEAAQMQRDAVRDGEEGVARPDPARGHHRSAVSRGRLLRPGEIPSARVPVDPEVHVRTVRAESHRRDHRQRPSVSGEPQRGGRQERWARI